MKANPYMELALAEAELAAAAGETPVGAVVVSPDGRIAGRGHNLVIANSDPTAHAEILAIREACLAAKSERLPGYDLYVTLEPCAMCAAAISFARIRRVYFGAADEKGGAVEHGVRFFGSPACHHAPEVYGGIAEARASAMLKEFFQSSALEPGKAQDKHVTACGTKGLARRCRWRPKNCGLSQGGKA